MSSSLIVVAPMKPEDAAAVRRLLVDGLAERWGTYETRLNPDIEALPQVRNDAVVLVATSSGEVVGTGTLVPTAERRAEVVRMSVARNRRGSGIGTLLLSHLLQLADERGVVEVCLETTSSWSSAVRFYLQRGFRKTHEQNGNTHFVCKIGLHEAPRLAELTTARLTIRPMTLADAEFIRGLLNEPSWLRFIGDRGVRTLEDARSYILAGPIDMYARLGIGFCMVQTRESGEPLGICGLAKRDYLDDIDLGFALLPRYWGRGYAIESASEVLRDAKERMKLRRIVATTRPDNVASQGLLERLGFQFERFIIRPDTGRTLQLYARNI